MERFGGRSHDTVQKSYGNLRGQPEGWGELDATLGNFLKVVSSHSRNISTASFSFVLLFH